MTKTVNIALAQLNPRVRETEANAKTVRRIVTEHPEADLIVFPELFLSGYTVTKVDELAILSSSPELGELTEVARENSTALIVGAAERVGDGIANSAVCVNEHGEFVATYRKVQLYGGKESDAFVAGDELLLVELCGLKVGLMICFDLEFPEVARSLARAGAELLVTISANMEPFGDDHAVFASARALENGLPHAYVNQFGPGEEGLNFTGGSKIVSPDGETIVRENSPGEVILDARLPFPMKSGVREDYLRELRSPLPEVRDVLSSTKSEVKT